MVEVCEGCEVHQWPWAAGSSPIGTTHGPFSKKRDIQPISCFYPLTLETFGQKKKVLWECDQLISTYIYLF